MTEPPVDRNPLDAERAAEEPRDSQLDQLLALVEQLSIALDRSDLVELEVEAAGTGLVLRRAEALAPLAAPGSGQGLGPHAGTGDAAHAGSDGGEAVQPEAERPAVHAPLTGIWYGAPAPGSAPYVRVGGEVAVGQVVGLIEAMKLFNEIKSDLAGRVARIVPEDGTLVKAKQALIEVEPL